MQISSFFLALYFSYSITLSITNLHIVSESRIGNVRNFEELFRNHYSPLCGYANMYLNDVDASEDMVQEVFMKLWKNREGLEIRTSIKSYLFRAVRNACLNMISHINIREEYKKHHELEVSEDEKNFTDESIVSELEDKIRKSIDSLPVERRKVFVLSRFEGLKYREIAERLNISVKTVENQMSKALKFLRENLVDYLPIILLIFKGLFRDGD